MTLAELIEKVEGLTGPSREVDAELYATIGGAPHTTEVGNRIVPFIKKGDPVTWPAYTTSLDAAVALCERVLPGHLWHVMPAAITLAEGRAKDLARFYVLATLRALHNQERHDA